MTKHLSAARDFVLHQSTQQATGVKAHKNFLKPRHAGNTSTHLPQPLKPPLTQPTHHATHRTVMSFPNQPHGGPAGAPPNMAQNFNAMLQRSMDSPQPEHAVEAPGQQPPAAGKPQCAQAQAGILLTHANAPHRLWGRIQRQWTTTLWTQRSRRRTTNRAPANPPHRSPSTSIPDVGDVARYGRQYGPTHTDDVVYGLKLTRPQRK